MTGTERRFCVSLISKLAFTAMACSSADKHLHLNARRQRRVRDEYHAYCKEVKPKMNCVTFLVFAGIFGADSVTLHRRYVRMDGIMGLVLFLPDCLLLK